MENSSLNLGIMKTVFVAMFVCLLTTGCATTKNLESRKTERGAAYAALLPEMKSLVDKGQIKVGMPEDAVYIAWGPPSQILQTENQNEAATVWVYRGGYLEETRYWAGWRYPRLEHDYQPRTYVSAEVVFVNGKVKQWRTLPQPTY
jgi:hypothetical protein